MQVSGVKLLHGSNEMGGFDEASEVHICNFQRVYPKPPNILHLLSRVPLILQNVPEGLHNGFLGAILCQSHPKNKTITDGGSTAPQNFCYQS